MPGDMNDGVEAPPKRLVVGAGVAGAPKALGVDPKPVLWPNGFGAMCYHKYTTTCKICKSAAGFASRRWAR